MHDLDLGTEDRILLAALKTMQEKGFKSVTIKDIAQISQVSEMTVFRHFKTKKGVLEAALKKYSYIPGFKKLFNEKIVWDLEHDLHLIAQSYLDFMINNQSLYLIAVQERTTMPEISAIISENTMQLKELIANYFIAMQEKRKINHTDAYMQAILFLTTLYGYFSSKSLWASQFISESKEQFLQHFILTFCNGIKK